MLGACNTCVKLQSRVTSSGTSVNLLPFVFCCYCCCCCCCLFVSSFFCLVFCCFCCCCLFVSSFFCLFVWFFVVVIVVVFFFFFFFFFFFCRPFCYCVLLSLSFFSFFFPFVFCLFDFGTVVYYSYFKGSFSLWAGLGDNLLLVRK